MKTPNVLNILSILSVVFLTLAACGPSPEQQAAMTSTAMTALAALWTATPTITPTATDTPTIIPSPTQTATPNPTMTPTITPTPTATHDPNRYYAPDNSFSLVPPPNWQPVDLGLQYPVLMGPKIGNDTLKLVFAEEKSPYINAWDQEISYEASIKKLLGNVTEISAKWEHPEDQESLYGYYRWEIEATQNNTLVHQIIGFYPGNYLLMAITFQRPQAADGKYDALADAAMKTALLHPTP